jgi:hypothetical protein
MDEQRPWHRLFAAAWQDFFRGTPVTVEAEKDLSVKKQLLDVLLIRKEPGPLLYPPPDGFEDLAPYNLVSFKSHREKLSAWTLQELMGHYVNLRKQDSPSMDEPDLLPAEDFRLFAVTARFPQNLIDDKIELRELKPGVYEVEALTKRIRVVVANQLPLQEQNAQLLVASASGPALAYGSKHYRIRDNQSSTILYQYLRGYGEEADVMPDLLEELTRQTIDQLLKELPLEKRLEGVPIEKRLEGVPIEEILAALSPEAREALARQLKANGSSQPSQEK